MIPIGAAVGAATSIASGIIGSGKRKREQKAAQAEFDQAINYAFIQTNPTRFIL